MTLADSFVELASKAIQSTTFLPLVAGSFQPNERRHWTKSYTDLPLRSDKHILNTVRKLASQISEHSDAIQLSATGADPRLWSKDGTGIEIEVAKIYLIIFMLACFEGCLRDTTRDRTLGYMHSLLNRRHDPTTSTHERRSP